jgi:ABC-type nitrate/sulfonate/bicarbonate transport system substrate-binding protein
MPTLRRPSIATFVLLGLVLSACSGGGAPATSAEASAPPAASAPASESAPASAATGEVPSPEVANIRIGICAPEATNLAYVIADRTGIYQKYGLTPEVTQFEGDGKCNQALVAGQVDVIGAGYGVAFSSAATDTPVKFIGNVAKTLPDGLFCGKDIKTADDVKGQKIAISTFGGTSHSSVLLSLKELGLTDSDVAITPTGGQDVRIAAVQGGSVGCAPVDLALESQMLEQGLNKLTDLKEASVEYGRGGPGASVEWLQANPNAALAFVAATLEGQNLIWKDPEKATEVAAEWLQLSPEDAKVRTDAFQATGNQSMMWSPSAFEAVKSALAIAEPSMADIDVTTLYDQSYLQKLVDNGFYEKIGAPTS